MKLIPALMSRSEICLDVKVADVHFNTSIGKSYYVLEDSALQRRPHLR